MILILASRGDDEAVSFASEFSGSARVLTCADLAGEASRLFFPNFTDSVIMVGGEAIHIPNISGVLNLLPAVFPEELSMYAQEERAYQVAEFRALLLFFMASLKCKVIGRATPTSLTGPVLNPFAWLALAQRAGIPVAAVSVSSSETQPSTEDKHWLDVEWLCGEILAPNGTVANVRTQLLAREARVEYLRARYQQREREFLFCGASTSPDIRNVRLREALKHHLVRQTT